MVGRKPSKEQDQEAVELLEKLKNKLNLKTDTELAEELRITTSQLAKWKHGLTKINKRWIEIILNQSSE